MNWWGEMMFGQSGQPAAAGAEDKEWSHELLEEKKTQSLFCHFSILALLGLEKIVAFFFYNPSPRPPFTTVAPKLLHN